MNIKTKFYDNYISNKQATISTKTNFFYEKLVKKLSASHSKSSSVLDLGCGNGEFLSYFNKFGFQDLLGVDISKEMIENSVEGVESYLVHSDIFVFLANNNKKFDIIILKDILEHFTLTEGVKLIQLVEGILNPNGVLFIHVPNAEGINSNSVFYGDITHEIFYSKRLIESVLILASFKFKNIHFLEDFPHTRSFFGISRYILYLIFTFPRRVLYLAESGTFSLLCSQNISCFIYK